MVVDLRRLCSFAGYGARGLLEPAPLRWYARIGRASSLSLAGVLRMATRATNYQCCAMGYPGCLVMGSFGYQWGE